MRTGLHGELVRAIRILVTAAPKLVGKEVADGSKDALGLVTRGNQAVADGLSNATGCLANAVKLALALQRSAVLNLNALDDLCARAKVLVHDLAGFGKHLQALEHRGTATNGRRRTKAVLVLFNLRHGHGGNPAARSGGSLFFGFILNSGRLGVIASSLLGARLPSMRLGAFLLGILLVFPLIIVVLVIKIVVQVVLKGATDALGMACRPVFGVVGAGTNHVQHAEHGGNGCLVVVGTRGARGKALVHRRGTQQQQGEGSKNAQHPEDVTCRGRDDRNHLKDSQCQNRNRKRPCQTLDQRLPLGKLVVVEEVLARGVVVRNDDDGTIALDHVGTGCAMHANDVLAAGTRANVSQ